MYRRIVKLKRGDQDFLVLISKPRVGDNDLIEQHYSIFVRMENWYLRIQTYLKRTGNTWRIDCVHTISSLLSATL